MNRKHFLRNGALAGISLSALAPASCHSNSSTEKKEEAPVPASPADFALNEATIDGLQEKMKSGEFTSRSITELYLKRIDAIDKNGPALNAVIEVNPDALSIADAMDKERKEGKLRGPLHGIPVLVKDNIDTGDKMMTTAGALAMTGNKAAKDAFIIQQLRAAGAVLLGKTNLSEWANFRSTRSTSGWSSRGGQTKQPYILDRNPSGSSAGSGTAVAANLCAVAIGTETDGSIVSPSSINGLVGIKPTVGLLSRSGIIPISKTQDTAGPMARTVKDAAILLGALTGIDPDDAITKESEGKSKTDYTAQLDANGLKGKRLGVESSFLKGNEGIVALYKEAIEALKKQGAEIVEIELVKKVNAAVGNTAEFAVLQYEFKDGLNAYLSKSNAPVKSLEAVMAFNKQNEAKAMPFFKQEILELSQARGGLDSKEYLDALKKTTGTRAVLNGLLKEHKLDALVSVTNGLACCIDLINGDYDTGFSTSSPAAMAGYPHITVPMGAVHHLPIGLSFFGAAYTEPQLISMAYAYEQATKKRTAPGFIGNANPA